MSTATGRRTATARRTPHPTVVIGALLVVLTVGALALVRPHDAADRRTPPRETTLTSAAVGCPAAFGDDRVRVATGTPDLDGTVTVTGAGRPEELPVSSGKVSELAGVPGPVAASATGDLASGLLAARFGKGELAAADCAHPEPERWFTAAGAGARHDSTIELVNPDEGPAVADVRVYSRGGPIDVPRLRGVTVSGHDSVRLALGELLPRRTDLALQVVVSRGRLSTSVLDTVPSLGSRRETSDFLPPQPEPTTETVLLGLAPGSGSDVLGVANPGDSEARVQVQVLTEDSAFVPEGLDEIRVPPGSLRSTRLSSLVRREVKGGALGLKVTSTVPVTVGMRSRIDTDLVHPAPVLASGSPMSLLVPDGDARIVLADAGAVGVATAHSWTADGRQLDDVSVELKPEQGGIIKLPARAALVTLEPKRTTVRAALLVTGRNGSTVLGFHELLTNALVPDVRPGLP